MTINCVILISWNKYCIDLIKRSQSDNTFFVQSCKNSKSLNEQNRERKKPKRWDQQFFPSYLKLRSLKRKVDFSDSYSADIPLLSQVSGRENVILAFKAPNIFWFSVRSSHSVKAHIFWEGHKFFRNLPLTLDYSTYSQKIGEDFTKCCGLLRIYEL